MGAPDKVHAFQRQTRSDDGLADNQLAVLEYPDALATVRSALMDVDGFHAVSWSFAGSLADWKSALLNRPRCD